MHFHNRLALYRIPKWIWVIIVSLVIAIFCVKGCHAGLLDGLFKGMVKAQLAEEMIGIKQSIQGDMSAIKGDISLVRGENAKLFDANIKLQAQVSAMAAAQAGMNNSISQMTMGNNNNVNDIEVYKIQAKLSEQAARMWKWILGLVFGLLVTQTTRLWKVTQNALKEASNSRWYSTELAKRSTNGDFEEIMQSKREYEEKKAKEAIPYKAWTVAQNAAQNLMKKEIYLFKRKA